MAKCCNSHAAKCCLLILASVVLFSSALVSVSHHNKVTRRAHRRPLLCLQSTTKSGANHQSTASSSSPQKSPESNFWTTVTQKNTTSSSSGIPAIHRLDRETGLLPPGAYRNIDIDDGRDVISPCLIAVGIHPPVTGHGGKGVWREGVENCQKLIDSGFNTFKVNPCYGKMLDNKRYVRNGRRRDPSSFAWEHMQQRTFQTDVRHQAETEFYQTLQQDTPSSVLRSCHFMVNLEVPSILSEESVTRGSDKEIAPVSFGNGWMVRESVSNALLRTKGECLDSVILEYRKNSPYHLDVLNTLFEMKQEGLIQSISTHNFPPSLLRSALGSGFNIHSNDVRGNLMNTYNLQSDGELGVLCNDHGSSRLVSAPLGGGLFTNQYCKIQERAQLSASSEKMFQTLLDSCPGMNWKRYRTIMDTLADISLKHQVSVESTALRWLLQINDGDSISVGTHLGMDFVEEEGGQPYSRQRNLRQVFTFSLEEDDMKRLYRVSGFTSEENMLSEMDTNREIDFENRALWM